MCYGLYKAKNHASRRILILKNETFFYMYKCVITPNDVEKNSHSWSNKLNWSEIFLLVLCCGPLEFGDPDALYIGHQRCNEPFA